MNYLKIYDDLCNNGKVSRTLEYSETHHIIPICLGGDNSIRNLTILTAREHYIAHKLLTKIYKNDSKLLFAFSMIAQKNKFQKRNLSSIEYESMKRAKSIAMKNCNPMKIPEIAAKAIQRRTERIILGEISPRKLSDKEKVNISNRMKGDSNPTRKFPDKHNFKNNSYVKGKVCYNNGIKNKYFYPTDIIPDGWVKGNKPYKRVRNGIESNHG